MTEDLRGRVDADVIVVGAGPAGASAAAHLCRAGLSVLLLDKRRFPRDKVCGDFVGPVALAELERLGVVATPEFGGVNRIRRAALHVDGRFIVERDLPTVPGLCRWAAVIPRQQLDGWIVEAAVGAGAELREGMRVLRYRTSPEDVAVTVAGPAGDETTVRARFLVGADGSASDVARQLRGGGIPRADRAIAVRAYVEGIDGPAARADLFFGRASFPGYGWIFPTGEGTANLGVGMMLETLPATRDNLRELLARCLRDDASMRERIGGGRIVGRVTGWPLATFNPRIPIVAARTVLTGDAAALINTVNGEGIQYALASGRWAAEALTAAMSAADATAARACLDGYARRVMAELRLDMSLARLWGQAIRNRRLSPACLGLIEAIGRRSVIDEEYASVAGGYLAGMVPARDVMSARMARGTAAETIATVRRGVRARIRRMRDGSHGAPVHAAAPAGANGAGGHVTRPRAGAAAELAWMAGVARAGVDLAVTHASDGRRRRDRST